jgi:hypothetical protein
VDRNRAVLSGLAGKSHTAERDSLLTSCQSGAISCIVVQLAMPTRRNETM